MTDVTRLDETEEEAARDETGDVADTDAEAAPEPEAKAEPEHKRRVAEDHKVFVGTGFFWGLIVGLILSTVIIVLAAQNTDDVVVRFLDWRLTTPLIVVILGAMLIGIVFDEIVGSIYRRRRRRILNERAELERLRRQVET